MELQQQQLQNGQELQTGDVNNLGTAALMDDRVLAELLRLAPFNGTAPQKLVLPFGTDFAPSGLQASSGVVQPTGSANGSVNIAPFRAVVGSTVAVGTNALQNWREIHSGVFVGGGGVWSANAPTALNVVQAIAANSSGYARWDVIYAAVTPLANQPAVQRAVKSPTTLAVSVGGTVTQLACTVTVGYTQGTPSASPALPSVPADSGGVYYIPLAYVVVPDGWSATSTLQGSQIMSAIPQPTGMSKSVGGLFAAPASSLNTQSTSTLTTTQLANWANNQGNSVSGRPNFVLPQDMTGLEVLFLPLDLTTSTGTQATNGLMLDQSRDWRRRFFLSFWQGGLAGAGGGHFAFDHGSSATYFIPSWQATGGPEQAMAGGVWFQFGQSFIQDYANLPGASPPSGACFVGYADHTALLNIANSTGVGLYIDASGYLRLYLNGSPNCMLFVVLLASRPFGNY